MFLKERQAPALLQRLPRLLHRLPKDHPAYELAMADQYKIRAGFGGEQHVDRLLRETTWREPIVFICDLQLVDPFCQIDTVMLTPHFALILEVKNYSGTLSFDETSFHLKQETRDGKKLGFNSPVTQVWNAQAELAILLGQLGVALPVHACIVLPYPTTLLEKAPAEMPVIYAYSLKRFLSTLPRTGSPLSSDDMALVGQHLLARHKPYTRKNFPEWYRYSPADLKKGVLCAVCGAHGVKLSQRLFYCNLCRSPIHDGHERALADWFEFASPDISTAQLCAYLGLTNKYAVRYLVRKLGLVRRAGRYRQG